MFNNTTIEAMQNYNERHAEEMKKIEADHKSAMEVLNNFREKINEASKRGDMAEMIKLINQQNEFVAANQL